MTVPVLAVAVILGGGTLLGAADPAAPSWLDFVTKGGAIAVFALVFWALLTGKLWVGRAVDQALKSKDAQIAQAVADRDYWRDVSMQTMRPLAERALGLAEMAARKQSAGSAGVTAGEPV